MKKITSILTLILILAFTTIVSASTSGMKMDKKVDGINASIVFNNKAVKPGDNQYTIILNDKDNKPISNAMVSTTVKMATSMDMSGQDMNKSKAMMTTLNESNVKGQYIGSANFTDKGKWNIKTKFTSNGKTESATFDVDVVSAGPNLLVIGGFLGVIVLVVIVVAVKKKK